MVSLREFMPVSCLLMVPGLLGVLKNYCLFELCWGEGGRDESPWPEAQTDPVERANEVEGFNPSDCRFCVSGVLELLVFIVFTIPLSLVTLAVLLPFAVLACPVYVR